MSPIPGTGTNVATLYLQQGTEQFDLAAYFDYNKEYLSFPLTDNTESLYLAVDSDQLVDDPAGQYKYRNNVGRAVIYAKANTNWLRQSTGAGN